MKNWTTEALVGDRRRAAPAFGAFLKKLPQAKMRVANRTSQGTSRANSVGGVKRRMAPPIAPPMRLMTKSLVMVSPGGVSACARPVTPVTTCAGNSATVEVMLAARASIPVSISDGRVMKDPPPASAFCAPAQIEATNRMRRGTIARSEGTQRRPFPVHSQRRAKNANATTRRRNPTLVLSVLSSCATKPVANSVGFEQAYWQNRSAGQGEALILLEYQSGRRATGRARNPEQPGCSRKQPPEEQLALLAARFLAPRILDRSLRRVLFNSRSSRRDCARHGRQASRRGVGRRRY